MTAAEQGRAGAAGGPGAQGRSAAELGLLPECLHQACAMRAEAAGVVSHALS